MQRTRELDPLSAMSYALSSQIAYQGRAYSIASEYARRAILIDSRFWIGYAQLAQDYGELGETDLALEAVREAARLSGNNTKMISLRGYLLAKRGQTAEALEMLQTLDEAARARYVPPYNMAIV